jgi:hypothetical protein
MKALFVISVIAISVTIFAACSKSSGGAGGGSGGSGGVTCSGTKSFSTEVNPIIQGNCTASSGCHEAGSINGPGPLTTYQQIFNARSAIRAAVLSGTMPKNGSLSSAQKNTIICWIDAGAANN